MAFYVLLLKESEDESSVIYSFGPHEEKLGRLQSKKADGVAREIEPVPTDNSEAFFTRAAVKLHQYWQKGDFPEKSCWAS
jgi:hypothetical protein